MGKTGVQGGGAPLAGLGVSPHETLKGGELPPLTSQPRVGPKTLANPKPAGVGKRESRGRSPLAGAVGDVPPRTKNKGRVANSCNQATSGTQNVGEPLVNEGGKMVGATILGHTLL